ncbi:hypothetical protein D3C84_1142960 [compost metagenome]
MKTNSPERSQYPISGVTSPWESPKRAPDKPHREADRTYPFHSTFLALMHRYSSRVSLVLIATSACPALDRK